MKLCLCGCNQTVAYPQRKYATWECRIRQNVVRTLAGYQHVKVPGWQYHRRTAGEIAANPRRHNRNVNPQSKGKKGRPAKQPFEMVSNKLCLKCDRPFPSESKFDRVCPRCESCWGNIYA